MLFSSKFEAAASLLVVEILIVMSFLDVDFYSRSDVAVLLPLHQLIHGELLELVKVINVKIKHWI